MHNVLTSMCERMNLLANQGREEWTQQDLEQIRHAYITFRRLPLSPGNDPPLWEPLQRMHWQPYPRDEELERLVGML